MKNLSKTLRLDYLQYKELLQMTQLRTTGLSKEAEKRLKRGETINQLIIQDKNKPVSLEEQIVYLYAMTLGILDNLSTAQVRNFRENIHPFIEGRYPNFFNDIRSTHDLSDESKIQLEEALRDYFKGALK
jgi:F-type H+/Na+-transporting ATPase subunit alpha